MKYSAYTVTIDLMNQGSHDTVLCANSNETFRYLQEWATVEDETNGGNEYQSVLDEMATIEAEPYHQVLFPHGVIVHVQELNNYSVNQLDKLRTNPSPELEKEFCSVCDVELAPDDEAYTDENTGAILCDAHSKCGGTGYVEHDPRIENRRVRIHCENPTDNWETRINGTCAEIKAHFKVGSYFDSASAIKRVEFL